MATWGIPDFRLPPGVVEEDVASVLERARAGAEALTELLDQLLEAEVHVDRRVQLVLVVERVLSKFPHEK